MKQRVEFQANLLVAVNEETGEEFLLETDRQIDERYQLAISDFDEKQETNRLLGGTEEAQARLKKAFLAQVEVQKAREKRERDAARPQAVEYRFTLVKPDYGGWQRIRAEAMEWNGDTGESRLDVARYCAMLLCEDGVKQNGRVLSREDIDGLAPLIGEELGKRLARALEPDRRRLVFTSRG